MLSARPERRRSTNNRSCLRLRSSVSVENKNAQIPSSITGHQCDNSRGRYRFHSDRKEKMARHVRPFFFLLMAAQLDLFFPLEQGSFFADARMEAQFEKCCGLGTSWALEGLGCEKFTGPVSGVPTVEQGLCLEAVDICCVKTYHEQQCEKGKSDARAGLACVSGTKTRRTGPGDYHRDCCEACKLGILTGSMGQGCAFQKFSFGIPWDPAFLECCHEASPSTSTSFTSDSTNLTSPSENTETSSPSSPSSPSSSSASTTQTTEFSPSFPTPPLDDICQIMKGLLCSDICIPTPGSYYCKCREGFTLLEDQKTCIQDLPSDRCKSSNPCEQRCTDNGVAVTCSCDPGYALANDNHSCIPKSAQQKNTAATDETTDYSSICPTGYRYNATNQVCDDVDECAESSDICKGELCYNQPGSYTCAKPPMPITKKPLTTTTPLPPSANQKCPDGSRFVRNRGCIDIDECREIEDACSSNEDCINTMGSYTCNCKIGFRRDNLTQACVDINECQMREDSCLATQRCDNTIGSYTCTRFLPCGTGYTLNAATEICEDDNECILGTHDCGEGYHCRNTLGSYRCDRNPRVPNAQSRIGLPTTTVATTTTTTTSAPMPPSLTPEGRTCPRGFRLEPGNKCVDIDECQENNNLCRRNFQHCINTIGSYRCTSRVICSNGYTLDPIFGSHCVDINECEDGSHECAPSQTCENRMGGYVCKCPPGHVNGPNNDCVDIDECSLYGNICGSNSRCENTVGSYRCVCRDGFQNVEGFNEVCEDIDECQRSPGLCQHKCINVWGSYRCACEPGFRLNSDNRSCSDINECTEFKNNHLCIGICENTPGSYACKCPKGYRLGYDERSCEDIDECRAGSVCRGSAEICHNTRGSYRCNRINCPAGYHQDSNRKNRCVRRMPCHPGDVACVKAPSHYSYNYITLVSMLPIAPNKSEELFKMKGFPLPSSTLQFSMAFVEARAPPGVQRATESCFALRRTAPTNVVLVMTQSIPGPQDIELDITMEVYYGSLYAGCVVAKILIFVSEYEF